MVRAPLGVRELPLGGAQDKKCNGGFECFLVWFLGLKCVSLSGLSRHNKDLLKNIFLFKIWNQKWSFNEQIKQNTVKMNLTIVEEDNSSSTT